jgi:hypothetical protein
VLASLEADVFPAIGGRAIADITAPDVFALLKVVADRGDRARVLRQRISAIFVYGIALSMVAVDPAQNLALAIPPKPRSKPQPALTDLQSCGSCWSIAKPSDAGRPPNLRCAFWL